MATEEQHRPKISITIHRIYCSHNQPYCNTPFSCSFQRMPGNGYRKKVIYEALKDVEASSNYCRRWTPQRMWSPCVTLPARWPFTFLLCGFQTHVNSPRVVISQSKPKRAKSEMQSCLPNMPQKRQRGTFKRGGGEGGRDRMQVLLQTYIL